MPVLPTSASDYTQFVRAQAVLPTAGKATNATVTTVNVSVASIIATASKVAVTAAPATKIIATPTVTSRSAHKGD
jgi:hypothetical protein